MDSNKDIIELLRECAAQDHGMAKLRDSLGIGLECGWQQRCLGKVADEIEADYMRLPVDADGVPFHIGDKVDSDHYEDGTIIGVHYLRAPNGVVFEEIAVQPNGWDTATWRDPEEYAHHHEPTVEDVLREYAIECEDAGNSGPEVKRLATEYAERIGRRLDR